MSNLHLHSRLFQDSFPILTLLLTNPKRTIPSNNKHLSLSHTPFKVGRFNGRFFYILHPRDITFFILSFLSNINGVICFIGTCSDRSKGRTNVIMDLFHVSKAPIPLSFPLMAFLCVSFTIFFTINAIENYWG